MRTCLNNELHSFNIVGGDCIKCGISQTKLSRILVSKKESKEIEIKKEFRKHKIDYEYQEIGIEMSKYFKDNIWWLFHKYSYPKIRQAFKICQRDSIYTISYFIGIIKKL